MAPVTRSRHKLANASMMEKLQPELLTRVLEFAELPERLQLCRCSTTLLRTITKDCPALWVDLQFFRNQPHWNSREQQQSGALTDAMVAALLKRVNAKTITKVLDLRYCGRITGSALSPLRRSRVLETVDLRTINYRIDFRLVSRILRTTIPYKLFEVKVDCLLTATPLQDAAEGWYTPMSIQKLLHDIRSARQKDAQNIMCSSCHHPVCEKSRQIVPNITGVPSTRCWECHNYFCRRANCDVTVLDCKECGAASCKECDVVRQCSECALSWCGECSTVSPACLFCKRAFCESFSCPGNSVEVFTCVTCNTTVCGNCKQQENYSIFTCGYCDEDKCGDCCEIVFCPVCDAERDSGYVCSDCIDFKTCKLCPDERFCSNCVVTCDQCRTSWCRRCTSSKDPWVSTCDACYESLCDDCGEFSHCDHCQNKFCSKQTCPSVDGGICSICAAKKRPAKRRKRG